MVPYQKKSGVLVMGLNGPISKNCIFNYYLVKSCPLSRLESNVKGCSISEHLSIQLKSAKKGVKSRP